MTAPVGRRVPDETIFTVLAERARRTPDWRLALYAGAGFVVTGAALTVAAVLLPAVPPFVAVSAFGVWGIIDRELEESPDAPGAPPARRRALVVARRAAAAIGTVAGIATLLVAMVFVLGYWRS